VASIVQETNTFSPQISTLAAFERSGIHEGREMAAVVAGTNTETEGALQRLAQRRAVPVPVLHTWAMSSGRLAGDALEELSARLRRALLRAAPLQGLVLSLHGALAAEGTDAADLALLRAARDVVGQETPISVCLDLHANVTQSLVSAADSLIGYHTYPHVDMAATGARATDILLDLLARERTPTTCVAKRSLLLPPDALLAGRPLDEIRTLADEMMSRDGVDDVSLFPVQPWLDVEELGFAATVTADEPLRAQQLADVVASRVWEIRDACESELLDPREAIRQAREAMPRPAILIESSDAPTAGAPADNPAMLALLLAHGHGLIIYETIVDVPAVSLCHGAGVGASLSLRLGSTIDATFGPPVCVNALVERIGDGPYRLTGPVYTGMEVSMGRWAVVAVETLRVLVTEQPACTYDPQTFRHVGLPPEEADIVVVRSVGLFRAGFAGIAHHAFHVDLPGASAPRLSTLTFERAPSDLYIV
jgi:microcystin degradation protein MlrC